MFFHNAQRRRGIPTTNTYRLHLAGSEKGKALFSQDCQEWMSEGKSDPRTKEIGVAVADFRDFMFPLPKKTCTKAPMTKGSGRDL